MITPLTTPYRRNKMSNVTFATYPIPVVVEGDKDGYLLYVSESGTYENDIWTIVLCDGGNVRHYNTSQVKIFHNLTFGIKK